MVGVLNEISVIVSMKLVYLTGGSMEESSWRGSLDSGSLSGCCAAGSFVWGASPSLSSRLSAHL